MATTSRKQVWTRKSFGRSIWACSSCRDKHTKCDETRPQCLKCIKYSRICTYSDADPSKEWQRSIITFNTSEKPSNKPLVMRKPEPKPTSKDLSREVAILKKRQVPPNVPCSVSAFTGEGYSIRDVQALSHFASVTAGDLIGSHQLWTQKGIQLAFTNDFLMHAVLMTSASHLQRLNPEAYHEHKIQSTKHFHLSLRSFRNALSSRTYVASNFEAVVATTFLFLMHASSNPIFDPKYPTVDALLQHSSGIYDIIRYHPCLAPSCIFQPICTPKLLPAAMPDTGPARDLINMVESSGADFNALDTNAKYYIGVIRSLTPVLDIVISRPPFGGASPDALLLYFVHWLSFLPPEFVKLVNTYDAKALIIMAHYYAAVAFVLSNWKYGWWWLRDRPEYMIGNISIFVGQRWKVWMKWPVLVLKLCRERRARSGYFSYESKFHFDNASRVDETELGVLSAVEIHPDKIKAEYRVSADKL